MACPRPSTFYLSEANSSDKSMRTPCPEVGPARFVVKRLGRPASAHRSHNADGAGRISVRKGLIDVLLTTVAGQKRVGPAHAYAERLRKQLLRDTWIWYRHCVKRGRVVRLHRQR